MEESTDQPRSSDRTNGNSLSSITPRKTRRGVIAIDPEEAEPLLCELLREARKRELAQMTNEQRAEQKLFEAGINRMLG